VKVLPINSCINYEDYFNDYKSLVFREHGFSPKSSQLTSFSFDGRQKTPFSSLPTLQAVLGLSCRDEILLSLHLPDS
jgi:hypothetical protein